MGDHITEHRHGGLTELPATAICGNDITSSCLYVSALAIMHAGKYAWVSLLMVAAVLFGLAFLFSLLVEDANFLTLSGVTIAYGLAYLGLLRALPLIHSDDIAEIRNMEFATLNRVLDVFVAPKKD